MIEETIVDLRNLIAAQTKNHKTRSGLTRRLAIIRALQIREEMEMSDENYLAQANADYTVKQLIQVALDLEDARMDNRTADLILANEAKIAFAVSSLVRQLEDIQRANKNSRAA